MEQEQAAVASRQWKVMRRTVKDNKVKRDTVAEKWFTTIYTALTDEMVGTLVSISTKWEEASGKERASLCRQLQETIFSVRPEESVIEQGDASFFLGSTESTSAMISFLQIVNIMRKKLDLEEKGGYTQENHDSWALTIDSICTLI